MALGADFITLQELRHYMNIVPTDFDAELSSAIASSTGEIIRHCHRDFNDAEAASLRTYKSFRNPERDEAFDYPSVLITDDFSTVAGLIVADGETSYDASALVLEPENGIVQGMIGFPFWRIKGSFPVNKRIQVTARWGWTAVPNPVRQAAFIIAADSFQLKDQRLGIAGSDAFGSVVTLRENTLAKKKLKEFRRDSVLVAG